jgi:hypothetical protein
MNSFELSEGCQQWVVGSSTKHPPEDNLLLEALAKAGFERGRNLRGGWGDSCAG